MQAQLKVMEATGVRTYESSDTFAKALEAVGVAYEAHTINKSESKESAAVLTLAERAACWAAFDAARTDARPADAFEAMAVMIAKAKKVDDDKLRPYRLRARDAMTLYRTQVEAANREKANPLTVAKRLREQGVKAAIGQAQIAVVADDAWSLAAGELATTVEDVKARVQRGDEEAALTYAAAVITAQSNAAIVNDARALVERLAQADPAAVAAIKAMFAD